MPPARLTATSLSAQLEGAWPPACGQPAAVPVARCLQERHAAIHLELDAGDEAGEVGGEEERGARQLCGPSQAPERDRCRDLALERGAVLGRDAHLPDDRGLGRARAEDVDPDAAV